MTVEVRPVDMRCNLDCKYCFGTPQRRADNLIPELDLEAVKKAIDRLESVKEELVLTGGEPLLADNTIIEDIFRHAYGKFDKLILQTNLTLLEAEHLKIFKRYQVNLGVSIDGWKDLNDPRRAENIGETRLLTGKTLENLKKIYKFNVGGGVIITIQEANAGTEQKLERLKEFIFWLREELDITSGNLHMLNTHTAVDCSLSPERHAEVFVELARFFTGETGFQWKPFSSIEKLLQGDCETVPCLWRKCDQWAASASYGIQPDGSYISCPLPLEGFNFLRADNRKYSRYLSLYQTPQEKGGCNNCRYFLLCAGNCPNTAVGADWRNRSFHCETIKALFEFYEDNVFTEQQDLILDEKYRSRLENWLIEQLRAGKLPSIGDKYKELKANNSS